MGGWFLPSQKFENFIQKHKAIRTGPFNPSIFMRSLAKIAHGAVTALCGHGNFKPLLLDIIHGRASNLNSLIGGFPSSEPQSGVLHTLDLMPLKWTINATGEERHLIAVRIRFFALLGTPQYMIIAGER